MKFKYIEHKDGRIQRALIRRKITRHVRLCRAKGPGSYDCEQDILKLLMRGEYAEAKALYLRHVAVRGVKPPTKLRAAMGVSA